MPPTFGTAVNTAVGGVVSYVRATATAALALTMPAPVYSFQPVPNVWVAERRITSATWAGARTEFACRTSAATAETIGAEKLVPSP